MLQRRLTSWLFALALLFGQAAAFAHALTHIDLHESALPDKVCEVCVAQAHLGSAAPASLIAFALPAGDFVAPPRCRAPACWHTLPWHLRARAARFIHYLNIFLSCVGLSAQALFIY